MNESSKPYQHDWDWEEYRLRMTIAELREPKPAVQWTHVGPANRNDEFHRVQKATQAWYWVFYTGWQPRELDAEYTFSLLEEMEGHVEKVKDGDIVFWRAGSGLPNNNRTDQRKELAIARAYVEWKSVQVCPVYSTSELVKLRNEHQRAIELLKISHHVDTRVRRYVAPIQLTRRGELDIQQFLTDIAREEKA